MDFFIRSVDISTDIQGIRETHGGDDHWGSDLACCNSQKTRLANGFFIQVAVSGKQIIGHAEWAVSDEAEHKYLYLGMLQARAGYQRMGVGTKLLETGAAYANEIGCAFLRTMPNAESAAFYQKNGFVKTGKSNSTLTLKTTDAPLRTAARVDKIPFAAIKTLPFVAGLYQHSSGHMWNIYNALSESDDRTVFSYRIGGSYVNIGAFMPTDRASVLCWTDEITDGLITEILAAAGGLGYKYLNFCVLSEYVPLFDAFEYTMSDDHDIFMERRL